MSSIAGTGTGLSGSIDVTLLNLDPIAKVHGPVQRGEVLLFEFGKYQTDEGRGDLLEDLYKHLFYSGY